MAACKSKTKARPPLPTDVDVLIIGAGPQGLAMASRLMLGSEAMQDVIPPLESYVRKPKDVRAHLKTNRRIDPSSFAVVDASGVWMERWRRQFKALGIQYLRSHEAMHPDAFDHSTLAVWAHSLKRNDFLFLEKMPKDGTYCGPFVLPSNRMMLDFCKHLVNMGHLDGHLWQAEAETLKPCEAGISVRLMTADGVREVLARHVVIARGPSWRRAWPGFYQHLEASAHEAILHAWDLFDDPKRMQKLQGRGVIVGGGLTSAHLCAQLAPRGKVELLLRRERRVKQYDLELSWMGTGRWEHRKGFETAPVEERAAMNKAVRDGGSVTPELDAVMSSLEKKGLLTLHEYTEVITASFDGTWTVVLSDDEVIEADYLICATGALVDAATDPLLAGLHEAHPIRMHAGLPVLTENLQWGELPVYLMGNLAALQLGPDAVNMTGAARGASRIWSAVAKWYGESDTKRAGS
eukprot:TRINITY_DN75139_c0_g1_i1.p1 TRINITY_DN75139_c0_g1~~TRINITY_DN75139_c0_g1_i1.p1  ORF type:complete len:478 (+),score=91.36 TRINITY_DN75139_c0_g1_i1:45-1436(+)